MTATSERCTWNLMFENKNNYFKYNGKRITKHALSCKQDV